MSQLLRKLLLLSLVPIVAFLIVIANFRFLYMAGGDQSLYLNPTRIFSSIIYAWDQSYAFTVGGQNVSFHLLMPFILFFELFSFLPPVVTEYSYFTLVFSSIFYASFYYFYTHLFGKKFLPSLASALLYFFNMFFFVSYVNYNIHLAFILLPLLFILCHRIIEFNAKNIILILMFISVVLPAIFINPPAALPLIPVIACYFVFLILSNRVRLMSVIGPGLFGLVLLALLNIWWMVPFVQTTFANRLGEAAQADAPQMFKTTSLFDAFRFMGGWAFNPEHLSVKHGRYDAWYYTPLFYISTYVPVILGYLGVVFSRRNKNVLFYFVLSLGSLFFIKGVLPPIGSWYDFAFRKVPGFFMFREPFTKFMLPHVLASSVLLGFFVLSLKSFVLKFSTYRKILALVFLGIFIPALPFLWGGWVPLRVNEGYSRSYLIKVPQYVLDFKAFFEGDLKNYRLITFPKITNTYLWEKGFSITNTTLSTFADRSVISSVADIYTPGLGDILDGIYKLAWHKDPGFLKVLGLFNVRFITLENDIDWRYRYSYALPPSQSGSFLDSLGISKIREFGKFTKEGLIKLTPMEEQNSLRNELYVELLGKPARVLYELPREYFLPKFYIPNETVYINGSSPNFVDLMNLEEHDIRTQYILTKESINPELLAISKSIVSLGDILEESTCVAGSYCYSFYTPQAGLYTLLVKKKDGIWEKIKDVNLTLGEKFNYEYVPPASEVTPLLHEEFYDGSEVFFEELPDWQANRSYDVSLKYKIKNGALEFFTGEFLPTYSSIGSVIGEVNWDLVEKGDFPPDHWASYHDRLRNDSPYFKDKNGFTHFIGTVKSHYKAAKGAIQMQVTSDGTAPVELELRDLIVQEQYTPTLVLLKKQEVLMTQPPTVTFTEINPTRYEILIRDAANPYSLVFSEAFSKNWKLFQAVDDTQRQVQASFFDGKIKEGLVKEAYFKLDFLDTWRKTPIAEDAHYKTNGYANAWYITPQDVNGLEDYTLVLEFIPQRTYYIVLAISGGTLLSSMVFGGVLSLKKKYAK